MKTRLLRISTFYIIFLLCILKTNAQSPLDLDNNNSFLKSHISGVISNNFYYLTDVEFGTLLTNLYRDSLFSSDETFIIDSIYYSDTLKADFIRWTQLHCGIEVEEGGVIEGIIACKDAFLSNYTVPNNLINCTVLCDNSTSKTDVADSLNLNQNDIEFQNTKISKVNSEIVDEYNVMHIYKTFFEDEEVLIYFDSYSCNIDKIIPLHNDHSSPASTSGLCFDQFVSVDVDDSSSGTNNGNNVYDLISDDNNKDIATIDLYPAVVAATNVNVGATTAANWAIVFYTGNVLPGDFEEPIEWVQKEGEGNWSPQSTSQKAAVDAHIFANNVWDFYSEKFDLNGSGNENNRLYMAVNIDAANAHIIRRGGADVIITGLKPNQNISFNSPETIGHEFTHAVINRVHDTQSNTVSGVWEGICDIMGNEAQLFFRVKNEVNITTNQWINYSAHGIKINLQYPKQSTDPKIDHYSELVDGVKAHEAAGIMTKMYSLLVDGGTFHNIQVFGIDREKALKIIYYTFKNSLSKSPSFKEARDATINTAIMLHGPCSDEVLATKAAWAAVGLPQGGYYQAVTVNGSSTVCSDGTYNGNINLNACATTLGQNFTWDYPSHWNVSITGPNDSEFQVLDFGGIDPPNIPWTYRITVTSPTGLKLFKYIRLINCTSTPDPCATVTATALTSNNNNFIGISRNEGISEKSQTLKNDLILYPNPTNGEVKIESINEIVDIAVLDPFTGERLSFEKKKNNSNLHSIFIHPLKSSRLVFVKIRTKDINGFEVENLKRIFLY